MDFADIPTFDPTFTDHTTGLEYIRSTVRQICDFLDVVLISILHIKLYLCTIHF